MADRQRADRRVELSGSRGSLQPPEEESLRALASALIELAVQVLRDEEERESMEEAA